MIRIDNKALKAFSAKLEIINHKAIPFAVRNTLNVAAFETQKEARAGIGKKMILRNKFTTRSILVNKVKGLRAGAMQSSVGSTQSYMVDQEFGGTRRKNGKRGVPLATGYASGEGDISSPRKRLPRLANTLRRIRLTRRSNKGKTRRQRNLITVRQAAKSSNRFIFLNTGRSKGIYRVLGGKRKPRIKMVFNLSHESVRIPRNPWLAPAVAKVTKKIANIHFRSLRFQLNRLRL